MSFPVFTSSNSIVFGTWVGTAPIYVITSDSSGNETNSIAKTDIDLVITLSSVESSHSGIVKINFLNETIGIDQSVLAYNQQCFLNFNQLSLISLLETTSIEFSVNGNLQFIEDNKLKLSFAGSAFGDLQSSVASQSIFTPQLLVN